MYNYQIETNISKIKYIGSFARQLMRSLCHKATRINHNIPVFQLKEFHDAIYQIMQNILPASFPIILYCSDDKDNLIYGSDITEFTQLYEKCMTKQGWVMSEVEFIMMGGPSFINILLGKETSSDMLNELK